MSESSPTRRTFLKSGALVSAMAVGGFPLRSPRGSRSPNETIGLGVIGVGGMGAAHAKAFLGLAKSGAANVRIVALSDVCKPRLDRCAAACNEALGGEPVATFRAYRDLLERSDVDAVVIASPEHWHAQMAIDAVAAGKDVYVEKPMTLDLEDALRLHHVARVSDRIIEVGTQYVTDPKYEKLRDLAASGTLGVPLSAFTAYGRNTPAGEWNYYAIEEGVVPGPNLDWDAWCGPLGPQPFDARVYPRWRRYRKYSTGIIGDLLVHQVTPLLRVLNQGWPVRVVASGAHMVDKAMENHDQVQVTAEFETGFQMVLFGSACNANVPPPTVRGSKSTVLMEGNACQVLPERPYAKEVDAAKHDSSGPSHDGLRLDFLECVRSRKAPLSPVELGLRCMVIVDLATRSLWEGKAYRFDPRYLTASPC